MLKRSCRPSFCSHSLSPEFLNQIHSVLPVKSCWVRAPLTLLPTPSGSSWHYGQCVYGKQGMFLQKQPPLGSPLEFVGYQGSWSSWCWHLLPVCLVVSNPDSTSLDPPYQLCHTACLPYGPPSVEKKDTRSSWASQIRAWRRQNWKHN